MSIRLIEALKRGTYDKMNSTNYLSNLSSGLFWIDYPFGSVEADDYPFALYHYEALGETLQLGSRVPAGSDLTLVFDTLSTNNITNELENLHGYLLDEFYGDGSVPINSITDDNGDPVSLAENWEDPVVQKTFEDMVSKPDSDVWHGIVRFHGKAVR